MTRAIIEAALFPRNSTVLTFVYCARHSQAPFGLSWSDLKELTRDPLCLDEKQFGHWLRNQELALPRICGQDSKTARQAFSQSSAGEDLPRQGRKIGGLSSPAR